jgi:predicted DNA-binding transcriptional regulator YafY
MAKITSKSKPAPRKARATAQPASHDTILRQFEMLRKIPRHPRRIGTRELLDHLAGLDFKVTIRTVQRDLEELSIPFELLDDGRRPAGWSWSAEAMCDIPGMDRMTALAFRMARLHLAPMLPPACMEYLAPHFARADKLLDGEGPGPKAWPRRVLVVSRHFLLQPPRFEKGVLDTVYMALWRGRRFRCQYRKRGEATPAEYVVNPLGLVFADQIVYLAATLWDYDDPLMLALHRIRKATPTEEPAGAPAGFDLREYVAAGAGGCLPPVAGRPLRLRALFEPGTVPHLAETPAGADQQLTRQEDGRWLLEATVPDSPQLRWWLQAFGAGVEVLEPSELRAEFAAAARLLAARYRLAT